MRKRYKISWLSEDPDFPVFVTHTHVAGDTQREAKEKLENQLKKIEAKNYKIILTEDMGLEEDWILDMWYKLDPRGYMSAWEPDISTSSMIKKLKYRNQGMYIGLKGT